MKESLIEMLMRKLPHFVKQDGAYSGTLDVANLAETAGIKRQTIYNANKLNLLSPATARALISVSDGLLEMNDFTPFF